jgi:hypothetical protein
VLSGDLKDSIVAKPRQEKRATKGKARLAPMPMQNEPMERIQWDQAYTECRWNFDLSKKKYPKQPFMRPTFDATGENAVKVFADTLKEGLEQVVKE